MINQKIERLIEEQQKHGEFIYPDYGKYCYSNIPSTILSFFGVKSNRSKLPKELYRDKIDVDTSNKVVLLLIDGFGFNQWKMYGQDNIFFKKFTQKGLVSPLTTIFPSTTAATITTINTGLTPQEHGLPEWVVYFREIDMIINTLPFTTLDGSNELMRMGVDPKILYKGNTLHENLKKEGVKSLAFLDRSYAYSEYSKLVFKGSFMNPFIDLSDLFVILRKSIEKENEPAYFYAYLGNLDSIAHKYGPHTEQYYSELSLISLLLEKELLNKIDRKAAKETIIIITSDHGQINVNPKKTIYLNKYRSLVNSFQKSHKGKKILPTGSSRDVFLHIKPNKLEEMYNFLSKKLEAKAKVMKTEEAIKEGLFGIGKPKKEFRDRIGNLLILPYKNNTVWYEHIKGKKFDMLGHHGGLCRDEMLVPFALAKLSDLV